MDPKELEKLKTSLENTQLDDAGWKQHTITCRNLAYSTNSDKICFTCVGVPCWVARKNDFKTRFPAKKYAEKVKAREWRQEVDKATSTMCKDYLKITARQRAAGATVLLVAPKPQSRNPGTQVIKLHCLKSCTAFQEKCNTPEKSKITIGIELGNASSWEHRGN